MIKCVPYIDSQAHKQPWVFAVVKDSIAKHKIRELVEAEEEINYSRRMRKSWVHDVSHLLNKLHGDDGMTTMCGYQLRKNLIRGHSSLLRCGCDSTHAAWHHTQALH